MWQSLDQLLARLDRVDQTALLRVEAGKRKQLPITGKLNVVCPVRQGGEARLVAVRVIECDLLVDPPNGQGPAVRGITNGAVDSVVRDVKIGTHGGHGSGEHSHDRSC